MSLADSSFSPDPPVEEETVLNSSSDSAAAAEASTTSSSHSLDRISRWHDVRMLLKLAFPNCLSFLVAFLIQFTSVIFIGQLGAEYLGAASLANMLANVTGFSVGNGATSALDALCSQAYGAKSYALVGRHTQRGMIILTIACIPVAWIWLYASTILGWMGIEARICELAGQYVFILIFGMWPSFMFECLRRFLQSQSVLWPMLVASVVTAVASVIMNYIFIYQLNMGFEGPAIASALSNWVMFFTITICIAGRIWYRRRKFAQGKYAPLTTLTQGGEAAASPREINGSGRGEDNENDENEEEEEKESQNELSSSLELEESSSHTHEEVELASMKHRSLRTSDDDETDETPASPSTVITIQQHSNATESTVIDNEDTWPSVFSREVFQGWWEFLRLGIPGSVSLFVEWGSYEVSASMAARLGATNLAVHSIFMSTAGLFYMIPLGIATAASICIGQFLGAARGDRAKQTADLALVLNAIYAIVSGGILILFLRPYWGIMFTKDEEVLRGCEHILPIMMLYLLFDHLKCVCMAILRGCGRAPITVYGNTLSCWIVGFPLAYILVFNPLRWELWGLWLSMSSAWATASGVYFIVIMRTKWEDEVESARQRTLRSLAAAVVVVVGAEGDDKLKRSPSPPPE